MAQKITTRKFTKNVIASIFAQIISLAVSFVLTLIVPKFIDGYQYAYWQTYVLYVGYVGILHFGLLDGIVLRYSKYDYNELDKPRLRSQFIILLAFTGIVTIAMSIISMMALGGENKLIFLLVAIGIVTKNVATYGSYLFQITNRINKYVVLTIAQRLSYGIMVVILLVIRVNDFYWYCAADLCGDLLGIIIGVIFNRGLYFGSMIKLHDIFKELRVNISAGIILMLANWSALLMAGSAKMLIQWHWDELLFGRVSFAFSVSNVFLVFVTAISVVLFPSLQRIDKDKLPQMYKSIRGLISPFLFLVILFYFPGCWILDKWLPMYAESLVYLGVLLPVIIYSSKVSLLTNNYLKVYRKEKKLLIVNIISIVIGVVLFVLCAYVLDNLITLIACVVFVIMLNSILAEVMVSRIIGAKLFKDFVIEGIMTVAFILCASLLPRWWGMLAYFVAFIAYGLINYKSIIAFIGQLSRRKKTYAIEAQSTVADGDTVVADNSINAVEEEKISQKESS